jgi:hypothetical protein
MNRRLLVSLVLSIPLLAPACKRDATTPPSDGETEAVVPPEQEGEAPSTEGEAIACERPDPLGPIIVTATQYARRHAATATRYSAVASTKEQPAEVCGIGAGVELLLSLTCDDGTNPFGGDFSKAHSSRAGNVGSGGRCGSIVDKYVVPCPEATYDIYIDSYICADAAAFF